MPAVATTVISHEALLGLAAPGGPVYNHWLRLMLRIDAAAKRNLSGHMVHVRTGNLRASQSAPTILSRGPLIVGVAENKASYALYVHEGTGQHEIRPRRAKVLRFTPTGGGRPVFRPMVMHPVTKAKPFLMDAMIEVVATGV